MRVKMAAAPTATQEDLEAAVRAENDSSSSNISCIEAKMAAAPAQEDLEATEL